MFGSFGAGFGSFGSGVGGLLPSFTNITSWLKTPTADGKTLINSKGVDATLTAVNCLSFDGTDDDVSTGYSLSGGDFVIDASVKFDSVTGQKTIHQCNNNSGYFFRVSNGSFQLYVGNGYVFSNGVGIDPVINTIYDTRVEYTASSNSWVVKAKLHTDSTYTTVGSGTRTPTFSSSVTMLGEKGGSGFLDGEYYSFKLTDSGVNKVEYPISEGSGDKLYDVSSSGNHGTIDGATWSTEDGIESWNHEYGFDIDGAVKVPALNTKTKQVATFDGVADAVVTDPVTLGNNFEFEWTGSISNTESYGTILGNKSSTNTEGNFTIERVAQSGAINIVFYPNGGTRQISHSQSVDFFDGSVKTHKVTVNNGALTYVVDNVTIYTNTFPAGNGFTDNSSIGIYGKPNGTSNCGGTLQNFKLTISGSTAFEYDFQNDIGTTTVQDLSTNDNDGTVTVGAGGLDSFWGQRVADASGSLVSADYATGNTSISNPAGYVHNNSECGVSMVTNSLTAAQLFAIDNSTATQTFIRKDNGNIVQILDYSAALTGSDLDRTRSYVG